MRLRYGALAAAVILAAFSAPGQGAGQIPDTFTNLEILPEDIPRGELVGIMRGFSFALHVRCNFCHVGEDPNDLTGYDFASDEKETKRVARTMMRMRAAINGEWIASTGREAPVMVECVTCHRGLSRPVRLEDELREALAEGGVDSALARYRELRDEYYGSAAYDFGAGTLNGLVETLTREGELEAALALIRLNLEHYPEEPYPRFLEAQALAASGDREAAIASLERAVELAPDVEFYRMQLERLRAPPA